MPIAAEARKTPVAVAEEKIGRTCAGSPIIPVSATRMTSIAETSLARPAVASRMEIEAVTLALPFTALILVTSTLPCSATSMASPIAATAERTRRSLLTS